MPDVIVTSIKEAQMERFVRRLLDPEGFGHAVTAEVRDEARVLLGHEESRNGKRSAMLHRKSNRSVTHYSDRLV